MLAIGSAGRLLMREWGREVPDRKLEADLLHPALIHFSLEKTCFVCQSGVSRKACATERSSRLHVPVGRGGGSLSTHIF